MARRPARRSTGRPRGRKAPAKPKTVKVLREVEERLPKDEYDRPEWQVDSQGRARHGWHQAETHYARRLSTWVKVALWCPTCKLGRLLAPTGSTKPVDR